MPWWEWITYAKDPVSRDLLTKVLERLDALAVPAPAPVANGHTEPAPVPIALDCGHRHHAYATYRDGVTTCYDCYVPKRGNRHGSI